MQVSQPSSGNLAFVEELFFLVTAPEDQEAEPVHLTAHVDLSEFQFTDAEIKKLKRLARKLEFALSDEFSRQWAAASVIVEVRPRSS